ncbi:transposable element Tcb2 transposase [Trichonephila clavipes]|nr:transposable element Tcb2 transposase [Trichonephila clavipes]
MEAGWSARRVAPQLGRSVVRRCWDQWIREMSFLLRTPSTDQSSRRPPHRKKCTRTANCFIGRHPGTDSTFTRGPVSSRTIRRRLAEGHLGSRCPLRVLPLTPTHRRFRLEWCRSRGNWTAAEWNRVVFSDKSRFNLSSDENRVRVWKPRGERLNPSLLHTAPTAGVMVWGVIAYNTRSPLVLTRGTMTAQRYVHDILQPHGLPLMQRLSGAIFQQDNARTHTARVPQDCFRTVSTFPWSARICLHSSISGIIWNDESGILRI